MAEPTLIGSLGQVGAIENFDGPPSPRLTGLFDLLNYGKDFLGLEAAEHLRSITTARVHMLKTKADDEDIE